ncbi:sugar transferase [Paenibacillus daejeonensis]|uniref:sugar transferase n=1 Tax=Paenibacillus daejeonensis TaxID=135193 RepID=UPI00035DA107|nr:sugar transferase [Paenibacillus daejeonensis]
MINPKEALHSGVLKNEQAGYLIAKRIIDMLGAAFGLLVLSPLLLLIALAIKLEDRKGPVLFSQIRIGKNGKPFRMYKFRSMVCDAESRLASLLASNEIEGAMFKMKDDPRVTRIGRFIRRTSLDEIPQFLNVLKGDMSLVGPRPPLPREVEQYTYYEKQRLLVTPGCTGLWQISGRNQLSFQEMVELDLRYIRQRSIRFDLTVIVKTAGMLLGSKDAY